jgi:intracellular sulfur oxidation DsrE/DsrF family protein
MKTNLFKKQLKLKAVFMILALLLIFFSGKAYAYKKIQALPYFKNKTIKVVFQITQDSPARWKLALGNAAKVVQIMSAHAINYKVDVVAYGPGLRVFIKKDDEKFYPLLQSLNAYGVNLVACHMTMHAMHVREKQLFPFVNVVYPGAVAYIIKKEMQGYAYIKP